MQPLRRRLRGRPPVLGRDLLEDLLAHYADRRRRLDAQPYAASIDAEHHNADAAGNHDGVAGAARENQH